MNNVRRLQKPFMPWANIYVVRRQRLISCQSRMIQTCRCEWGSFLAAGWFQPPACRERQQDRSWCLDSSSFPSGPSFPFFYEAVGDRIIWLPRLRSCYGVRLSWLDYRIAAGWNAPCQCMLLSMKSVKTVFHTVACTISFRFSLHADFLRPDIVAKPSWRFIQL